MIKQFLELALQGKVITNDMKLTITVQNEDNLYSDVYHGREQIEYASDVEYRQLAEDMASEVFVCAVLNLLDVEKQSFIGEFKIYSEK